MKRRATKKPEFHLLKLGKGPDGDAENLAKMFEAITGKRPSPEEIKEAAASLQDGKPRPTDEPPKP